MRRTKRIGRYHLVARIAYGGMAEIFRGFTYERDGFRRDVAVKRLLPHFVEDEQLVDMLVDEFKLVSNLRHPNIAAVYELVEVEDALLIAMEYVDGKDLRSTLDRAIKSRFKLDFDLIAYAMVKALDGLHDAHEARDTSGRALEIVHRDVSPSNILVTYDGHVKICDFGVAKARQNRVNTKTGIIKGKIKYMSPEQAFGHKLDRRSDVFSAGSVLYELCTGRPPFRARNEIDLIFAVRAANPVPAEAINPAIPPELATIIRRAMARSAEERYPSAGAFAKVLGRFLERHNASFRRARLASVMKQLWAQEIESELRSLEDLVLDESVSADLGRNLIADAQGPEAEVSRFVPYAEQEAAQAKAAAPKGAAPPPLPPGSGEDRTAQTAQVGTVQEDIIHYDDLDVVTSNSIKPEA